MNDELATISSLKKVLESAGAGEGIARALVREIRGMGPEGAAVARMILIGYPISISLGPLVKSKSEEVSMLSALVGSATKSSSTLVGKKGRTFAAVLERWAKMKENEKLEIRVQAFRALLTSGVLGAVTAMLASLGPLVASLNFVEGTPPVAAGSLLLAAGGMTAISSGMLGFFMSGRRFYINVLVALTMYAIVSSVASPLVSFSAPSPWGIK